MQLNAIKQMERIARQDNSVVSLAQGIPFLNANPNLHNAAIQAMKTRVADSYSDPQGLLLLRQKLSEHLLSRNMRYTPSEIVVTAGAIEGLSAVLRAIIKDSRNQVIVPTPVYGAYFKLIEVAAGHGVEIPLQEDREWLLDVDAILDAMNTSTAAVLLCNPNNPTGTIYREGDLQKIAKKAADLGIVVISDEVYSNMTFSDREVYSLAMSSQFHDVVVRVMSFSKDFSLTGWRVGYVHGPSHLVRDIVAVHDTLVNCAPVISQYVAIQALDMFDEIITQNRHIYKLHRDEMVRILQKSEQLSFYIPEAGYCLFPRINSLDNSLDFALQLAKKGVAVVPGASFGHVGEGHVRLCFGRSLRDVRKGSELLVDFLS